MSNRFNQRLVRKLLQTPGFKERLIASLPRMIPYKELAQALLAPGM